MKYIYNGDCIVCFSKTQLIQTAIDIRNFDPDRKFSVIYGDLPTSVKIKQANQFNDARNPQNILIATDAIGMGLNLNIRRVIFSTSGSIWKGFREGIAMTYNPVDHEIFKGLISEKIEDIEKAGIFPTSRQLESLASCLPHASFIQLLDMFSSLKWAELLKHFPFSIHDFYTFAPSLFVPPKEMFPPIWLRLPTTLQQREIDKILCKSLVEKKVKLALTFHALEELNDAYEVVRACVWLSSRFPGSFVDVKNIRE
uniref:Helicase C-terminal domain-containing protein n=1 Tax=Ditylenchus dipsaci TaxID=166011 RepID=A0A915EAW4_9BILA